MTETDDELDDLDDPDDLVKRVAERAANGVDGLPARIGGEQLAEAERRLGFALHPLLARLYRDVADGGFGPEYQLLPLLGPGESVVGKYLADREAGAGDGDEAGEEGAGTDDGGLSDHPQWPEGVVPILTWGCGMYACVDCTDPRGQVLLYEPNAYFGGVGVECWYFDAVSLAAWLETWLAGTGWYEEDAQERGEAVDPEPWEQAGARLSGNAEVQPAS